jgi:hypothetical protein
MIYSIHIPKTAGTSFRKALEERYGDRLALYYGPTDPKTHDLLRVRRSELAARIPVLEQHGIEVLHGHYYLHAVRSHVTDPTQVWTWLRDPIERTLSHYAFYQERPQDRSLAEQVREGGLSLEAFAQEAKIRNLQSRYLQGFDLKDLGFVGATERFELGLALLFGGEAPQLKRRYNATAKRGRSDVATRLRLAAINARDMELYAEGLRLLVDRVAGAAAIKAPERPKAAGTSFVKRLIQRVA